MFHCGGLCLRRWFLFTVILFFKFCLSVRLLSVLRGHLVFSSPPQRSDFEGFLSQILSITCLSYLNSSERASISLLNVECQTRELLVPFLLRLWYDAVLDWGLNPGPPALEASALPLGYRGGGFYGNDLRFRVMMCVYGDESCVWWLCWCRCLVYVYDDCVGVGAWFMFMMIVMV